MDPTIVTPFIQTVGTWVEQRYLAEEPLLWVACQVLHDRWKVGIWFGVQRFSVLEDGIPVEYSFGGQDITSEDWEDHPASYDAYLPDNGTAKVLALFEKHFQTNFVIRIYEDDAVFGVASFKLEGIKAALDKLEGACNIPRP